MHIRKDYVPVTLDGKRLEINGAPVILPTAKAARLEAIRLNDLAAKGFIAPGYYSIIEPTLADSPMPLNFGKGF